MQKAANIAVLLTALACLTALGISVYPGVLNRAIYITVMLLVVPVIAVSSAIRLPRVVYDLWIKPHRADASPVKFPWRPIVAVLAMLFLTFGLLKLYVPRRVAFAFSRSAFDAFVAQAPAPGLPVTLNRRVGLYMVDEFAVDPRGGVFFRVYFGGDGFGPNQMSYGFVYRPNDEGTPFGAAHYRLGRLGGDWYWFGVSDDWW